MTEAHQPAFVLIHGGSMTARYWDLVLPLLESPALAVDLPGRGSRPADVNDIRIADWVDAVVEDIVLVGHSLAGMTMPAVATRLSHRMRHLVSSSATVPAHGERAVEVLRPDIKEIVGSVEDAIVSGKLRLNPSRKLKVKQRRLSDK